MLAHISVACVLVEINLNEKQQQQQSFSDKPLLVLNDVQAMPNIAICLGLAHQKDEYVCVHETNVTLKHTLVMKCKNT